MHTIDTIYKIHMDSRHKANMYFEVF